METIKAIGKVGPDGVLRVEIPTQMPAGEVEIILVMDVTKPTDANGWPIGFFERTYGALADDPIERGEQPPLETRDTIE